jgi:prolyl-tRNA synthetase
MDYYEKVKGAYSKIFTRLGFNFKIVEASGGVFTDKFTHEFQVLNANGEDIIYVCDKCDFAQNKEIFKGKAGEKCPKCKKGKIKEEAKTVEVGNIFPLGTWYAERMKMYFTDRDGGKKPVWFGSYGIGPTRVMGTLVEVSHDDKGIIWNKNVAPFDVHLLQLNFGQLSKWAKEVYEKLISHGIDVLLDDRDVSVGQKFADADLIGIPVRLVVSERNLDKIEWKNRDAGEIELLSLDEVLRRIKK